MKFSNDNWITVKVLPDGPFFHIRGQQRRLHDLLVARGSAGSTWNEIQSSTGLVNYKGVVHRLRKLGILIQRTWQRTSRGRIARYFLTETVEVREGRHDPW